MDIHPHEETWEGNNFRMSHCIWSKRIVRRIRTRPGWIGRAIIMKRKTWDPVCAIMYAEKLIWPGTAGAGLVRCTGAMPWHSLRDQNFQREPQDYSIFPSRPAQTYLNAILMFARWLKTTPSWIRWLRYLALIYARRGRRWVFLNSNHARCWELLFDFALKALSY